MSRDAREAWANAIVGLVISTGLIRLLRAAGAWDAPEVALSAGFFVVSVARSYVIRRIFRLGE